MGMDWFFLDCYSAVSFCLKTDLSGCWVRIQRTKEDLFRPCDLVEKRMMPTEHKEFEPGARCMRAAGSYGTLEKYEFEWIECVGKVEYSLPRECLHNAEYDHAPHTSYAAIRAGRGKSSSFPSHWSASFFKSCFLVFSDRIPYGQAQRKYFSLIVGKEPGTEWNLYQPYFPRQITWSTQKGIQQNVFVHKSWNSSQSFQSFGLKTFLLISSIIPTNFTLKSASGFTFFFAHYVICRGKLC